jgi:hypothetical protein
MGGVLTAAQIVTQACQIAKCPGFVSQAGQRLNGILSDLCQDYDFDIAKGFYQFNFNPSLVSQIDSNVIAGGGPYNFPADYLRMKKDDFFYLISGFPYPMIAIDLVQFDLTPQMAGLQTYPQWVATDMSQSPPVAYVWPPPSGAFPCTLRYYRQMPQIATPETSATIPWLPNAEYLITKLAAAMMQLASDDRADAFDRKANEILDRYLKMKDDSSNRVESVQMDRRRFGPTYPSVLPTKNIPW